MQSPAHKPGFAIDPLGSIHDLTFVDLERLLEADGVRPIHAGSVWRVLHRGLATDLGPEHDFLPPVRRWLDSQLSQGMRLDCPTVSEALVSTDGATRKLLLRLEDGQEVETVVMGYPGRYTACVSTQAGCAMGCVFCATGQMGFLRNLRPGEIVAQVLAAQRMLQASGDAGLRNLVLMGMGEPLANYDAVIQALRIVSDSRGTNISPSRISISTVGVVPGILRLAEENQPYPLAVSLHATNDAERTALVPVNQRWPLASLLDACRIYSAKTSRKIFFGWTLMETINDTPEHARQLVALLEGLDAHVNLIHLNPTDQFRGGASGASAAALFKSILQEAGVACTTRQRRGIDVAAGCGQLRSRTGGGGKRVE